MVSFVAMDTAKRHERQPKLPDLQIQEWAARRYGVITRDELRELGLSANAICRRVKAGFLIPIHPGVLRVAAVPPSWIQSAYAACRWLEPCVVVSHRAAAVMWGLGDIVDCAVEVTVDRPLRSSDGVVIHRTGAMPGCDRRVRNRIPVTDPTRTVIDCCSVLPEPVAEAVMDDAFHAGLTSVPRLNERVAALCAPGRNGVGIAARLLDKRLREGADPESRLTRKLLRLIVSSYLPNPISLHGIRLRDGRILHPDLAYPDVKVAIEADGFRDHGRKVVWKNDKARDNALQGLGWIVLRFGWDDVVGRPDYVVATIADALRSRGLVLD